MVDATDAGSGMVVLGRIGKPRGVHGEVRVQSWTRPPRNLLDQPVWWLKGGQGWVAFDVVEARASGRGFSARLAGVEDRGSAAATLTGREIAVPRERLAAAAEDEVFWADLEGLAVVSVDGVDLGRVHYLIETGSNDVLVVRGDRERLIPFTADVVTQVDLETGRLTVDWDPEF